MFLIRKFGDLMAKILYKLFFLIDTINFGAVDSTTKAAGVECGGAGVLRIIKFVFEILDILFFVVPMGLIVIVSFDFFKSVIAGKSDDMKKNFMMAVKRILFCIALFLISPVVDFSMKLLGDENIGYLQCITIALEDDLSQYEVEYETNEEVPTPNFNRNNSGYEISGGGGSMTEDDYTHLNDYNQNNPEIASKSICANGGYTYDQGACGLSVYMAIRYYLIKKDTDILEFGKEACSTGFFNGKGASWNIVSDNNSSYPEKYGIKSTPRTGMTYSDIVSELENGKAISMTIRCGHQTSHLGGFNFGSNEHFIGLVGYNKSKDQIYVYNPGGANTGWTEKDKFDTYAMNCKTGTWVMEAT